MTRGPKGMQVGDTFEAERSRWQVVAIDPGRRQAVGQLLGGSSVLRRFRARQITRVERPARRLS